MHTSIVNNQSLRWILVPAATAVAAAKDGTNCDPKPNLICKRSQLPIYVDEPEQKQEVVITEKDDTIDVIADYVGTVRKTIKSAVDEVKAYASVGEDAINQTKENLDGLVDFLRKEENTVPRAGAIAIGALAGLILGLRGRWFKRTIYSTAGGLAMAAVCYPKEAAEYSQVGLDEAKKYVTIGYNFVQGVGEDDPPVELPSLPSLPTSLTEAWESVKSTATSLVSDTQQQVSKPEESKK